MTYFELGSARDIFEKSERELARLKADFSMDNVFNFFVTAYHIQDYVRRTSSVSQTALESFLADTDVKDCRDLCDKGKHLRLTKRSDPKTKIYSGAIGGAPLNTIGVNAGDKWVLLIDSREVEIEWLAERIVEKWRKFLDQHSL